MLRKANINDIQLIQQLAVESWHAAYKTILGRDQIEYMLKLMYSEEVLKVHLSNPHFPYYIILDGEKTVGFVGFEYDVEPHTTKLHRLYLIPSAKGKGLGKEAIDMVKSDMVKYGNTRLILTVNKNNSAKALYEKQGFKTYEEAVFDIGKGYVMDDYLMEWYS